MKKRIFTKLVPAVSALVLLLLLMLYVTWNDLVKFVVPIFH